MALQVAHSRIVVGVAVADDLHGDFLGKAPAEVIEVAHQCSVEAGIGGQGQIALSTQAVDGAGRIAPSQLRIDLAAIGGNHSRKRGLKRRRHDDAVDIVLAALYQSNGRLHVGIRLIACGNSHRLRNLGIEMIGADHGGRRSRAGIDAVEGHQVEALGQLRCKAIGKGPHIVQFHILGRIEEFIRNANTVFHLHGNDGHRRSGGTALGLRSILGYHVHLTVQREGELLHPVKGDRLCRAQGGQCALALGEVYQLRHQLLREHTASAQNICHNLLSFCQILCKLPQGSFLRVHRITLTVSQGRCSLCFGKQGCQRFRILPDARLVLSCQSGCHRSRQTEFQRNFRFYRVGLVSLVFRRQLVNLSLQFCGLIGSLLLRLLEGADLLLIGADFALQLVIICVFFRSDPALTSQPVLNGLVELFLRGDGCELHALLLSPLTRRSVFMLKSYSTPARKKSPRFAVRKRGDCELCD
uniref:Uncharacterized protein n=1 Tax=Siphoviridae sp. ctWBz6 TaxID=2825536 RepID=A0A8S5QG81_9CAUD|nr:MAG TPA: hypothetical protein [Siphoviridae sp. ctWBz6]